MKNLKQWNAAVAAIGRENKTVSKVLDKAIDVTGYSSSTFTLSWVSTADSKEKALLKSFNDMIRGHIDAAFGSHIRIDALVMR